MSDSKVPRERAGPYGDQIFLPDPAERARVMLGVSRPGDSLWSEPVEQIPKKKKAATAPKKSKTAYNFYQLKERDNVCNEVWETMGSNCNKMYHNAEVARIIGKRWRELPESQKSEFQRLALEDKLRYQREMREYDSENNRTSGKGEAQASEQKVMQPSTKPHHQKRKPQASIPMPTPKSITDNQDHTSSSGFSLHIQPPSPPPNQANRFPVQSMNAPMQEAPPPRSLSPSGFFKSLSPLSSSSPVIASQENSTSGSTLLPPQMRLNVGSAGPAGMETQSQPQAQSQPLTQSQSPNMNDPLGMGISTDLWWNQPDVTVPNPDSLGSSGGGPRSPSLNQCVIPNDLQIPPIPLGIDEAEKNQKEISAMLDTDFNTDFDSLMDTEREEEEKKKIEETNAFIL